MPWLRRDVLAAASVSVASIAARAAGLEAGDQSADIERAARDCARAQSWLTGSDLAPVAPTERPSIVLKASAHPKADAWVVKNVFQPAFEVLRRMSNGAIAVDAGWGESRHPAQEGFEAIADRRTDFAPCYTTWDAARYPMSQLLALPGLFPSTAIATAASEALYEPFLRREFERPGVLMGRLKATGPYHLFARKRLRGLADVGGLRVATSAGIDSRIVEALGGKAVALSSVELLPAFTAGAVDAVSLADGSAEVFGVGTQSTCRLEIGMSMLNLEFGLSADFARALNDNQRLVLNDWLRAQAQAEAQVFYGYGGALAREKFRRAGCEFVDLSPGEREQLKTRMAALTDDIAAQMDGRGLPGTRFVREARSIVAAMGPADDNQLMEAAIEKPTWLLPGKRPTL